MGAARKAVIQLAAIGLLGLPTTAAHAGIGVPLYPMPAGDLDGDGHADLLTFQGEDAQSYYHGFMKGPLDVVARRGSTGVALWRMRIARFGTAFPVRLGAGTRVLKVEPTIWFDGTPRFDIQRVTMVNGRTGKTLWSREFVAEIYARSTLFPLPLGGTWGRTNAISYASSMPNATGDGRDDIFIITTDAEFQSDLVSGITQRVHQTGRVLNGATGDEVGSAEGNTDEWFFSSVDGRLVHPTPDFNGDGRADLVALSGSQGDASITAYTGRGATLWTTEVPGEVVSVQATDLTGDGRAEVVLGRGLTPSEIPLVLDGRTGARLWQRITSDEPVSVGDADGDGADDFRFTPGTGDNESNGMPMAVVSGRTGAEIWKKRFTYPAPEGGVSTVVCCFEPSEDYDGDGVLDTLVHFTAFSNGDVVAHKAEARSGRDGSAIWGSSAVFYPTNVLGWSQQVARQFAPFLSADMDRNGTEDLLNEELRPHTENRLVLRDGATASVRRVYGFSLQQADRPLTLAFAADVVAGGGLELIAGSRGDEVFAATTTGRLWTLSR